MQIASILLIILIALSESWLQPWLSVVGVAAPLVFISLMIMASNSVLSRSKLPWLGLLAGLTIDISSATVFGANSLYYLAVSWLLVYKIPEINKPQQLWVRVGISALAALIQPWYLQLVNRQFSPDVEYNLWISAIRMGWVIVIGLLIFWHSSHKESSEL